METEWRQMTFLIIETSFMLMSRMLLVGLWANLSLP